MDLKPGTVDYEIPANNYTRSLERHDQRVSQESYNDKISDCDRDIRRNQKKQKPGNQGKRRLILSICKEPAFPRGLNWVSILDITISVIATTTTIARKTAATTNNTM